MKLFKSVFTAVTLFFLVVTGVSLSQAELRSVVPGSSSTKELLAAMNVFTPTDGTGATDETAELEAFLAAHSGHAFVRSGDILKLADAGHAIAGTYDFRAECLVKGTCTLKHANDHNAILYDVPDSVAFNSATDVTAVANPTSTAINKDDKLTRLTVSSVSGYSVGDYVLIQDSVSLPSRIGSTKTITNVAWDAGNSKCVVTTSASHGYSATDRVYIKGVVATVGGTKVDYIDGSDGYGRLYNITLGDGSGASTTTKFTLQAINNTTDTTSGTDVNCDTGTYSSGGTASKSNGWAGEANQVAGVDTTNKYIYLTHKLKFGNLYVQAPRLLRYTRARTFSLAGFKITATGDTSDVTLVTSNPSIDVMNVPEAELDHNYCENTWDACIRLMGTPNARGTNTKSFNLPNRATIAADSSGATVTSATRANPAVFTAVAHGFSNNKEVTFTTAPTGWSGIVNHIYRVVNKTNDTFELADTYNNEVDSSGYSNAWSGTQVTSSTDDVTGLGYTISTYGPDFGTDINGIVSYNGRHTTTTDGVQNTWGATLSTTTAVIGRRGQPTYITIENGECHGSFGVCWDSHEEGADIHYRNISSYYPERGPQFGSYSGRSMQIRAKDVTVDGFYQHGGRDGPIVRATEHDSVSINTFRNIAIVDTVAAGTSKGSTCSGSSTGYDSGFTFCSNAANTNIPINYIFNYSTRNVSFPFMVYEKAKVEANDIRLRDFQAIAEKYAGGQLTLRNVIADESTNTHTASYNYGIGLRSDGSNDTGNVAIIQGLRLVKGSNVDYPRHIFDEVDTTATKYYYLGGFEEQNDSAVTDTLLLKSGATTLSLYSKISNPLQPFDFGATIEAPTNKTYTVLYNADFGGTITATKTICSSGTATVTFKINTSALGGAANAASSSGDSVTQSTSNVFVAGDKIVATVSANASCADLNLTVKYKRTL